MHLRAYELCVVRCVGGLHSPLQCKPSNLSIGDLKHMLLVQGALVGRLMLDLYPILSQM